MTTRANTESTRRTWMLMRRQITERSSNAVQIFVGRQGRVTLAQMRTVIVRQLAADFPWAQVGNPLVLGAVNECLNNAIRGLKVPGFRKGQQFYSCRQSNGTWDVVAIMNMRDDEWDQKDAEQLRNIRGARAHRRDIATLRQRSNELQTRLERMVGR